jgi:hypothetical protein
VSLDKVERGQVNASKRFIFDMPFLELPLRKPQMKNLQAILDLKKNEQKDLSLLSIKRKKKALLLTTRKMPSPRTFRHLQKKKKKSQIHSQSAVASRRAREKNGHNTYQTGSFVAHS